MEPGQVNQLTADVSTLKDGMEDLKSAVERVALAVQKLALIEERQTAHQVQVQRLSDQVERLQQQQNDFLLQRVREESHPARISSLESSVKTLLEERTRQEASRQTIGSAGRVFWTLFGGGISSLITFLIMEFSKAPR